MKKTKNLLLGLTLVCSCGPASKIHFINLETEMNKVIDLKISPEELDLGCCGYEWVTYLDTGYYSVISKFPDFNSEINPRYELKALANLPYDTLHDKGSYRTIRAAIEDSEELKFFLNDSLFDCTKSQPEVVLFYKRKALFEVCNGYFVVELFDLQTIGVVKVNQMYT